MRALINVNCILIGFYDFSFHYRKYIFTNIEHNRELKSSNFG